MYVCVFVCVFEEFGSKTLYKLILINLWNLIYWWKPLFSVSNFHIVYLGYNNIKKSNPDLDFQIFII